jgi:hypothetical protein
MQGACAILSSVPCPALQYFFSQITQTARHSGKTLRDTKCVLIFSTSFVRHISHSMKNRASEIKTVCRSASNVPLCLTISTETGTFSTYTFEIYSNTKFHKNPSSGSRNVPCRRRQKQILSKSIDIRTSANLAAKTHTTINLHKPDSNMEH